MLPFVFRVFMLPDIIMGVGNTIEGVSYPHLIHLLFCSVVIDIAAKT